MVIFGARLKASKKRSLLINFCISGEAVLYVAFVQVFLERPKRNRHLLDDPILEDLFFVLWKTEVPFHIGP